MEGVRAEVLPPNRESVGDYFAYVWEFIHTLTAAVTPLQPEPGPSTTWDKFKSYLEAEEARLSTNLKAVDYVIDGTDTLTLITGAGRIEKVGASQYIHQPSLKCVLQTVFPLIYLLMKRHYEIMRAMRTKVLDMRELWSGVESLHRVRDAMEYRMNDLTSTPSSISLPLSVSLTLLITQIYFSNTKLTPRSSSRISLMAL